MFIFSICGQFLCACKPAPDPRITALEARIDGLEASVSNVNIIAEKANKNEINTYTNVVKLLETLRNQESNMVALESITGALGPALASLEARLEALEASHPTNKPVAGTRSTPAPARTASAMKEGIPLEIYNKIVAKALDEFPDNYTEQVAVIRMEIEAYKKLHP